MTELMASPLTPTALAAALCMLLLTSSPIFRRASRDLRTPHAARTTRRWSARWIHRPQRQPSQVAPNALAHWADDIARSLRHGATLRAALRSVTPADLSLAHHAEALWHLLDRGATVPDACASWRSEHDDTQLLATLAAVLTATATIGGSAAAPLDRFAAAMRQRGSEDLERRAHSAQAAMSARVLTVVPIGVLALLLATDHHVRAIVTEPAGALVIALGLGLNAAGGLWMRRIVGHPGRADSLS